MYLIQKTHSFTSPAGKICTITGFLEMGALGLASFGPEESAKKFITKGGASNFIRKMRLMDCKPIKLQS